MQINSCKKRLSIACFSLFLIQAIRALTCVGEIEASTLSPVTNAQVAVKHETYQRVLDIVFSRDVPYSRGSLWTVVLRFLPNTGPEYQIIIRRDRSKEIGGELVEYVPLGKSIYAQLNDVMASREKEDAIELSQLIKVQRHQVRLSDTKVRELISPFFSSLLGTTKKLQQKWVESDTLGTESIHLHGTFYELRYEQGLSELSVKLLEKETGKPISQYSENLVKWMNSIKQQARVLRKSGNQ
jgi:hypothetical protein